MKKKKLPNTIPQWTLWKNKEGWKLFDYLTLWATVYRVPAGDPHLGKEPVDYDRIYCNVASCPPTKLLYSHDYFPAGEWGKAKRYCEQIIRDLRKRGLNANK